MLNLIKSNGRNILKKYVSENLNHTEEYTLWADSDQIDTGATWSDLFNFFLDENKIPQDILEKALSADPTPVRDPNYDPDLRDLLGDEDYEAVAEEMIG